MSGNSNLPKVHEQEEEAQLGCCQTSMRNDLFLYLLKTSKKLWFSVFRGYGKRSGAWNGLAGSKIRFFGSKYHKILFLKNIQIKLVIQSF